MTKLRLDEIQTYFDKDTNEELELNFDYYKSIIDGIIVQLDGVPLLKNLRSNKIFFPQKTKYIIEYFLNKAKKEGEKGILLNPKKNKVRYDFAEKFDFKYSHIDYEYIPGLMTEYSNDGFLTPVFFNLKVLNKYSQDPDYQLEILSGTYGSINKGEEWNIQFGINKNNKVIMWLGDIDKLPEDEKYYLRSENIESDHTIHSAFYNSQIEVQWAKLSIESKTFKDKNRLNDITKEKYGFELYSFHGEISNILENLNLPIFWTEEHISPFIESLNSIFVESLNSKEIKIHLKVLEPTLTNSKLEG